MARQIYQTRNGVQVPLSSREIKSYVMKEQGWSSEQYNKEYDKLRNRLRAYEAYQRQSGLPVEPQSPAHLLYFESKAQHRLGAEYRPSLERQRLQAFPSSSTGRKLTPRTLARLDALYTNTTERAFGRFIEANPTAQLIARPQEIIIDAASGKRRLARPDDPTDEVFTGYLIPEPARREQALKDLADKVHAKQDEAGKIQSRSAIPFGQAVGSDPETDFDIEKYI